MKHFNKYFAASVLRVFLFAAVVFYFIGTQKVKAQCGPNTPSYTVDLSGNPDSA
jgi:uncharacterized membrane protein